MDIFWAFENDTSLIRRLLLKILAVWEMEYQINEMMV